MKDEGGAVATGGVERRARNAEKDRNGIKSDEEKTEGRKRRRQTGRQHYLR